MSRAPETPSSGSVGVFTETYTKPGPSNTLPTQSIGVPPSGPHKPLEDNRSYGIRELCVHYTCLRITLQ